MKKKNKPCMESIEFDCLDGEAKFWCHISEEDHVVHEAVGSFVKSQNGNVVINTRYAIRWYNVEMEIE